MHHIVFILQKHPASFAGGAQKQVYYLSRGFRDRGWRVSFIADESPPPVHEVPGQTYSLPDRGYYEGFLNFLRIVRRIRELKPDVVYHRVSGVYTAPAAAGAGLSGSLFVWGISTTSECYLKKFSSKPKGFNLKGWARRGADAFMDRTIQAAGSRAHLIVCQSSGQEKLIQRHFPDANSLIVPNILAEDESEGKPVKTSGGRILWVGRPLAVKCPWRFVELADRLQDQSLCFRMAGISGMEDLAAFQNGREKGSLPSNLSCLGYLSPEALREEYRAAGLVVCTSRVEGFPNVFLEAWNHGRPVLSFWRDDDQILRKKAAGWYVADVDGAERLIRQLFQNPGRLSAMGRSARRLVREQFTLERSLEKLEPALLDLLNSRRSRPL